MTTDNGSREKPGHKKHATNVLASDDPEPVPAWSAASASSILAGIEEKYRKVIAAAYKRRGGRFTSWTYEDHIALEAAIFETENELEHRGARNGCSDIEPVRGMRARRIALEALVPREGPMLVVSESSKYSHLQRSRPVMRVSD
jgi:hypothetical protein